MGDQIIRVSPGTVSVYPTTERKGRAKQLQLILKPSSLELHKALKDWRNGKSPKHLIELGDLFNISLQNEPNQIKGDCISLMSPEMTYFILPNDNESTLNDWFELLMERVREARSLKVLRPVFREEFFEASWDINIVKKPKLRKDYAKEEKIDDLAEKLAEIQGRKRLCISATCFLLFKMGVRPSSDPDQPFDKETYTELPINVISNYGKQERYFFIRVGRCSEIGQGELWMATEGGASATQLHDKISKINQRDAEKRRQQGIVLSVGGLSSRTLKSTLLRQRARENKSKEAAKKGIEEGGEDEQPVQIVETLPEKKTPPPPLPEPIVIVPPPNITSPQLNSTRGESSKVTTPKKKVPFADMAFKIGNKFHYNSSSSSTSTAGMFTSNPEYNKDAPDQSSVNAYVDPPPHTSRNEEMPPPRTLSPRNCYNTIAEDYMSYDAVVDSRKASAAQAYPIRQVSVMSGSESTNNMTSAVTARLSDRPINETTSDYLMMNNGFKIPDEPLRFPMKEARSYVSDISDSNESCYSSAAKRAKRESTSDFGDDPNAHNQRTYSLGSKPPLTTMPIARDLSDLTTLNPTSEEFKIDDIRKRAHSAGSKTWSRGTYRKVTESQDIRNRTNSFGTSSALAALRRQRQPKFVENDDHAVIDFSDGSNKGSMASIDSPLARSRNSSVGIHASNIRTAAELAVASSNLIAEKLAAIKVEPSPSPRSGYGHGHDDSMSSSSSSSTSKQSSSNRRGSAPDASPLLSDSDYVLMPGPGKTSRSTKLKKIPEKGSDTEEFDNMEHNSSSFFDEDDEMIEDLITPKRAYVTGTTLNQGGLEYAVIATSSAGPTARPAPPASSLPLIHSFAPPLPISTQTSISGGSGSASGTPPIGIMIAPSFSTANPASAAAASSPKHSSASPNQNNHCEYTVINPSTNK
uniref:IRS-type PTB domain-containing protein n=1 Tax=Panagrolaimus sp. ES5 TaxID=591445 RepID=A0AC34GPH4_9BILA